MPPATADLISDLEIFQGVLNLTLRKTVDVCLGLRVRVGGEAGTVRGGESVWHEAPPSVPRHTQAVHSGRRTVKAGILDWVGWVIPVGGLEAEEDIQYSKYRGSKLRNVINLNFKVVSTSNEYSTSQHTQYMYTHTHTHRGTPLVPQGKWPLLYTAK